MTRSAATCDPVLALRRGNGPDCLGATEAPLAAEGPPAALCPAGEHDSAAGNLALAHWLAPKLRERAPKDR